MNPFKWNVQNRQIHRKYIQKQKQRPKQMSDCQGPGEEEMEYDC